MRPPKVNTKLKWHIFDEFHRFCANPGYISDSPIRFDYDGKTTKVFLVDEFLWTV